MQYEVLMFKSIYAKYQTLFLVMKPLRLIFTFACVAVKILIGLGLPFQGKTFLVVRDVPRHSEKFLEES